MMAIPHWANYIVNYLKGEELDLPKHHLRAIAQEAQYYKLIGDQLYKKGKGQVLHLCMPKEKYILVLEHAHATIVGGHFSANSTARTIMWSSLWWPTLHMDVELYVARCEDARGLNRQEPKTLCL